MYLTKTINGVEICYDESGAAEGPPIVLLTGWAHDMRLYDGMLPYLAAKYWVIRLNWRGHSINRDYTEDFGVDEQVSDTLGLLEALDVDRFYLVSHSHGGWPALEIADRLGKDRVLCLLMIDQIMTPPPPEFISGLQAMQSKATWRAARRGLFDHWLAHSKNQAVQDHFTYCMGSYGYPMWSLSCRVIESAYQAHGSPLERMKKIKDPQPIRHIFSHPLDTPEYRKLHEDMGKVNSWFSYADLKGETHFPDLEIPQRVCEEMEDLIKVAAK